MKTIKDLQAIVDKAQRIVVDGREYIGVLDKDKNAINYAHVLGKFSDWLKNINIEETKTINLSPSAQYTTTTLDLDDLNSLGNLLGDMAHAKKYFREYTENDIFHRLIK